MAAIRSSWSPGRLAAIAGAALASALLVVATQAPADLLALAVHAASRGRVELADATGTIWRGHAVLVLASGAQAGGATPARVPGQTEWRISPWPLLMGTLEATLSNPSVLESPLALQIDHGRNATIEADRLRLPAQILTGLGAPWTTIQPGGEIELDWDTLRYTGGMLRGGIRGEWSGASSRLSPVVPFGHFRVVANGVFPGAQLRLETISGPIELTGSGTIADGNRLRFQGAARVQPGTGMAVATQLSGLITLLGPRDGDSAVLTIGN